MSENETNIQISIKEIYRILCRKCRRKLRELIKEKITDQMVDRIIGEEQDR